MRSGANVGGESSYDSPQADLGLPSLPVILDPLQLRRHLGCFALSPWYWAETGDAQVRLIGWHSGRRCIVEITIHTATGDHTLIGKAYARDRSDIFQTMVRISEAGFGPDEEFSVPQPLAYLPELNLLLQEKVEGPLVTRVFLTGDERDRTAAAERCARWLARFHAVAPKEGPAFDLNAHLESLGDWSRSIADAGHPLAAKVDRIVQRLERVAATLAPIKNCARHGDFTAAQVILAPGRTTTCDWDNHGVADPSRDAARFVASLGRTALDTLGSIRALDSMAELFLKTYLSVGPPEVGSNLPFYRAARHLQQVRRKIGWPGWMEKNEATLDESLRVLGER